jgi:Zn-dependent protease with chaperone function
LSASLWRAFLKGMAFPVGLLVFFAAAPAWLDHRVHDSVRTSIDKLALTEPQKVIRARELAAIDYSRVAGKDYSGPYTALRARMEQSGLGPRFRRLEWGFRLSALLVGVLLAFFLTILVMSRRARRSPADLIVMYRWGWRLGISAALAKVFLLIPLLAYGLYELTSLATDHVLPGLIAGVVIGGVLALWRSSAILLRSVPLEFGEPMSRPAAAADAPELWAVVREASDRLGTKPPDNIVLGMKANCYVTELSVQCDSAKVAGRTLFLSLPLMRRLTPDEILAIIGHELGHFVGEDTRVTREFYPLRFKSHRTLFAVAQAGWVGWTSAHSLLFFQLSFDAAERATSRARELKADEAAARLTSAATVGRALVRFQVFAEALGMGVTGKGGIKLDRPYEESLQAIIDRSLLPDEAFWSRLFEESMPHPLDTHPKLRVRLASLGLAWSATEAKACAVEGGESAYSRWLGARDALFSEQAQRADEALLKIRTQSALAAADCATKEGREFLATHFPERRWKTRRLAYGLPVGFLVFLAAILLFCMTVSPLAIGQFALGAAALLVGGLALCFWRQHRKGEFLLRAGALEYTGWRRPLLFSEVRDIKAVRVYGAISVTFLFKEKEPPYWRFAVLATKRAKLALNLGMIDAGKDEVFKLLILYANRRLPGEAAGVPAGGPAPGPAGKITSP